MALGLLVVLVAGLLLFNFIKKGKISPQTQNETATQTQEGQPAFALPTTHKVGTGENLWTIAEKYYHSGYNWVTIAKENKLVNADVVEVGQILSIPKAEVITPVGTSSTSMGMEKIEANTYKVVKGDDLWHIAVRAYGDGYAWTKIAQANKLINPNVIHSGNVLTLPR